MTLVRLGYVAMSLNVKNCSPSQTMTHTQFIKIKDREAAIRKLERIASSNLMNCLRLLKHNLVHDIDFFRFSSKLIPLANHPDLPDWNYIAPLKESLGEIREFLESHPKMRVDFHPEHFVVLNTRDKEAFKMALKTLQLHNKLLTGIGLSPDHRCVLHVGGGYNDKEQALERFINNWGLIPVPIQSMILLENDDKVFTLRETLYLCEKISIPLVFDLHHHLANRENDADWKAEWQRVIETWRHSKLPVKMHISSPKSDKDFRAHAEFIDSKVFYEFLMDIKGSVPQLDVMIEAKGKDNALFSLMKELKSEQHIEQVNGASFYLT